MPRKDAPSLTAIAPSQKWKIPKRGTDGEWYPIVRVGRHIPFGYEQDSDDKDILQPIPEQLEMLEQAKRYLAEYSLRMVARWLTEQSGRYISHVGLNKRVSIEYKRQRTARAHRDYERRFKEASEKARKLEEDRLGGKGTRNLDTDS
tara:strand:- start:23521 stop:23961 length:441 start_codon:yes stop_codon:yes gene_type:complete